MGQKYLQDNDILFLYRNLVESQKNDFRGRFPVNKKKNKGLEEYKVGNITTVYIPEAKELPTLAEENHIYIKLRKKKNEHRVPSLLGHLRNAFCHNYFMGVDEKFQIEDYQFFDENKNRLNKPKKNMIGNIRIVDLINLISVLKK